MLWAVKISYSCHPDCLISNIIRSCVWTIANSWRRRTLLLSAFHATFQGCGFPACGQLEMSAMCNVKNIISYVHSCLSESEAKGYRSPGHLSGEVITILCTFILFTLFANVVYRTSVFKPFVQNCPKETAEILWYYWKSQIWFWIPDSITFASSRFVRARRYIWSALDCRKSPPDINIP